MIHVKTRDLVLPGQLIAEGKYKTRDGAFREGENIFSSVVGLADVREETISVIPLGGQYIPRVGDMVIGVVIDDHRAGWIVDIKSTYTATLLVSDFLRQKVDLFKEDISKILTIGDVVAVEVRSVDERMDILLEGGRPGLGRIKSGKMIEISPMKVPRVLGKKGSMFDVIQNGTGCKLMVGRNGRIMVWGKDEGMINNAVEAIFTIEREAHTSGLTDRIRLMLEKMKSEVN